MTTDRISAPVRPATTAGARAAHDAKPARAGFADLLGGAHAASARPPAPAFVLTVAASATAVPAARSPIGAIAASARVPAPSAEDPAAAAQTGPAATAASVAVGARAASSLNSRR